MKLIVPIEPVPASRPRVTSRGIVYYPKRHRDYQKAVKAWLNSYKNIALSGSESLFRVEMVFYVSLPKSMSKKQRKALVGKPCTKYDLDNLAKLCADEVLVGTFIKDDSQIVEWNLKKIWSEEGKTKIILEELKLK